MRATPKTRDQHLFDPGPKRILSLDGGGLRGAFTLGVLHELESRLRERFGNDPAFRLADYFDLIAGTSTGAIIAATLALGLSPIDIYRDHYRKLGPTVFRKHGVWSGPIGAVLAQVTQGAYRPKFDKAVLAEYLRKAVGEETRLGDERLRTGLLMLTKRLDTHSVWALGNNPKGRYFGPPASNCDYPLWEILRASAAAPTFFEPVRLNIGEVLGEFIDGGMSPFNDPSLQALMYATLGGYGVGWPMGADKLFLLSVGTGTFEPSKPGVDGQGRAELARVKDAFFSVLHDTQVLTKTLMQWISTSPTATAIDSEMGDLAGDRIADRPLITYVRYDTELSEEGLEPLKPWLTVDPSELDMASLAEMDEPDNVETLWEIGRAVGATAIDDAHLPTTFDAGV